MLLTHYRVEAVAKALIFTLPDFHFDRMTANTICGIGCFAGKREILKRTCKESDEVRYQMFHRSNQLTNPLLMSVSAICTAFVAAPFLRLSATIHMFSVFG